ncbi:ABC transporter permease [Homoserinimonas sp. A447]
MTIVDYLMANAGQVLFLMQQHVEVVLISVGTAAVIGVGLGFWADSRPMLRRALLSVTGTLLTIPSYALFALMIPLFGLGAGPTLAALVIYGIFPILQNTVTGIAGVDPAIIDAARGLGMSNRRRLSTIVLPLAWPVILNGIRVATIMLVATAAIAAAVNGPGLGELIFRGLARIGGANALNEVLTGVIGVVLVALALDLIFLLTAKLTTPRGLNV